MQQRDRLLALGKGNYSLEPIYRPPAKKTGEALKRLTISLHSQVLNVDMARHLRDIAFVLNIIECLLRNQCGLDEN